MKVLKFGGTSVRDATRIETVAGLVADAATSSRVAVVVSALGGTTDELDRAAKLAPSDLESALEVAADLRERHRQALAGIAATDDDELASEQQALFRELEETLRGVALLRECSTKTLDRVLSFGERLSAPLVAAALTARGVEARAVDARSMVVTTRDHGKARVIPEPTQEAIRRQFADDEKTLVVTGFLGATEDGETTTLGRGGSDLTAALLGAALAAEEIQIWTDVDGVLSADPRIVSQAFPLERISYEELLELSHFGAEVVFPPTVVPARHAGIPLLIKNTLNPSAPGTLVTEKVDDGKLLSENVGTNNVGPRGSAPDDDQARGQRGRPVTGISSIPNVSLLRLEGDGMLAVPGIAGRLFAALASADISVLLISQASSEHSICFAVPPSDAEASRSAIEREFSREIDLGLIERPIVEHEQSVIAVVGEGMRERPGISGRLFTDLGRHEVSVRAISQGSSELNISLVVDRRNQETAVRTIHDSFFRDLDHRLELIVAGAGRVSTALLRQIAELRERGRPAIDLEVCGLFDSRHQWLDRKGLDLTAATSGDWRSTLEQRGEAVDSERLSQFLRRGAGQRAIVDCTASDQMLGWYLESMAERAIVVSANKLPFAGSLDTYRQLKNARRAFGRGLYYEATVGAGLPVLRTLRSIIDSGDQLVRIEGSMSGTLGLLLEALRQGKRFSKALEQAHAGGYTEPDPREDLSGRDVARKLLILARDAGWALEPADVRVEPLIDLDDDDLPLDSFWGELAPADKHLAARQQAADNNQQTLVYRAALEHGKATVGLEQVERDHPLAQISGTDNLFAFYTERYSKSPLVLRGPGAGTEVTAGGVLADLLQAHAEAAPAAPLPSPPPSSPNRTETLPAKDHSERWRGRQ